MASITLNTLALGMSNTGTGNPFSIPFQYLMFVLRNAVFFWPETESLVWLLVSERKAGHLLKWTTCFRAGFQHGGLPRRKRRLSRESRVRAKVGTRIQGSRDGMGLEKGDG